MFCQVFNLDAVLFALALVLWLVGRTTFATVTSSDHLYIVVTKDDEVTVLLSVSEAHRSLTEATRL